MAQSIKLGVVGGRRGGAFRRALPLLSDRVQLTAICDLSEEMLARWREDYPGIATFSSYADFLERSGCDAVFVATPLRLHVEQTVAALAAGKHVLCEVIAATTVEEAWRLVEAVEQSGLVYMMAENYCYMRPNMMVQRMAEQGLFGDLTCAEAAYINDHRPSVFTPEGRLTWWGVWRQELAGNGYPSHALGPLAQWLRVGQEPGNRLVRTLTWTSREASTGRWAREHFGADHPAAQPDFFQMGDSATTLIETSQGVLITLRVDWASNRPCNMTHYGLQGTAGAYLAPRMAREDPLLWIEGRSPGTNSRNAEWESLWAYASEYEHPRWKELLASGHAPEQGGGEILLLEDFVNAVAGQIPPPINVYDAVTWSCISPLSDASLRAGGAPVEIPDFGAHQARATH